MKMVKADMSANPNEPLFLHDHGRTTGPWGNNYGYHITNREADDESVGDDTGYSLLVYDQISEEEGRRLVACWNACRGVSTDWLTNEKSIVLLGTPIADRLKEIEQERDALLLALKGLHKVCELALQGKDGQQHVYFETRAGHFVAADGVMKAAEEAICQAGG